MNKLFLVTGATGNIGQELCRLLSQKGYSLILVARQEDKLLKLASQLQEEYQNKVTYFSTEFGQAKIDFNKTMFGKLGIDGLVIMPPQPRKSTDSLPADEEWKQLFNTSFIGPLALIRESLPFLKQKNGRVILISGISSIQPMTNYATSNVLRTAWLGQMKSLADIYGPDKITFNSLSLGGVMTSEFIRQLNHEATQRNISVEDISQERFSNVPLRKYATVNEVTSMIDFMLTSEAAQHITGQNIAFDGGFTRPY